MAKWRVEFYGEIEVEAETEEDASRAGFAKLAEDGADNHLFADLDPIFAGVDAETEEVIARIPPERVTI